jgi:hypothetical protein
MTTDSCRGLIYFSRSLKNQSVPGLTNGDGLIFDEVSRPE